MGGRGLEGFRNLNQRIQGSDFGQAKSLADYLDMRKYGGAQGRRDASARTMAQARGLQKQIDSKTICNRWRWRRWWPRYGCKCFKISCCHKIKRFRLYEGWSRTIMPRSTKNLALQKIESHEKLCRIMQKQTHEKIEKLETSIERIEKF
jgi:hypothetical protein